MADELKFKNDAFVIHWRKLRCPKDAETCTPNINSNVIETPYYCLHHYDEIVFSHGYTSVHEATNAVKKPHEPNAVMTKRMLVFQAEGEHSPGYAVDALGPVVYFGLLRINHRIQGIPCLEIESALVDYLRKYTPKSVQWSVLRSFAYGEVLLLLSSSDVASCELMFSDLRTLQLSPCCAAPALDVVADWPCVRLNTDGVEDLFSSSAFAGISKHLVKGIKVVGICRNDVHSRYTCTHAMNGKVYGADPLTDGDHADVAPRRPVLLEHGERQVAWSSRPDRNLLGDIRTLREHCCDSPSCSIHIVRHATPREKGNALFQELPPSFRLDDYTARIGDDYPEISAVREAPGMRLTADHLSSVQNQIAYAIRNPFICREFADLAPMLKKTVTVCMNIIRTEEDANQGRFRQNPETLKDLRRNDRGNAQQLATYLEHTLKNRMRDDPLNYWHIPNYAELGATGFSRLARVPAHSFARTLKEFGITWQGICGIGTRPIYMQNSYIGIIGAPIAATMEPYRLFGLGHEVGHALWEELNHRPDKADEARWIENHFTDFFRSTPMPGHPDLYDKQFTDSQKAYLYKESTEFFADAFCLRYAFGGEIQRFLEAWIEYIAYYLEFDAENEALALQAGSPCGASRKNRADRYHYRLFMSAAFWGIDKNSYSEDELWREAKEQVGNAIKNMVAANALDGSPILPVFGQINHKITDTFTGTGGDKKKKQLFDFQQGLKKWLDHIAKPQGNCTITSGKRIAEKWLAGVVVREPFCLPFYPLQCLGAGSNLAANAAAIFSISHWAELAEIS